MHQRTWRTALLIAIACGTGLLAQSSSLTYPQARKGDVVDDYFGTKVADPYRWMEDLNAPEVKQWVDAENAVTFKYLDALPQRDALKKRITELWNYPRVTPPRYEGRHWFYNRNSGLQRQSVVFTRETLNGPETVALDPNILSPDGSVALSGFVPAPDAQHFAYGQSEGGSDWSTLLHPRARHRQAAARRRPLGQVQQPVVDRRRQGLLLRTLSGAARGQGARGRGARQEDLLPRARHAAVGRPADLRAPRRADALHRRRDRRDRPLPVRLHEQGHEQQERAVREGSRQPDRAEARRAGAAAVPRTHRCLRAARRRGRHAVPADRPRRAEQEGRRGADRSARRRELEDDRPREQERHRFGAARRRQAGGQRARRRGERGPLLQSRRIAGRTDHAARPRLDQRAGRPFRPSGNLLYVHVAAVSGDRVPLRPGDRQEHAVRGAEADVRSGAVHDRASVRDVEGRHARADVHHAPQGPDERRSEPDDALRLRRLRHLRGCRASGPRCRPGSSGAACGRRPTCAAAASTARRGTRPGCSRRSRTCSTTSSPRRSIW